MSEAAFDEILRRLGEAGARYVVIGGLALNAWGVVRGTKDVDVVIASEPENLQVVAATAVSIDGRVELKDSFVSSQRGIAAALASGERVFIETRLGALDVVTGLPGVPPFSELADRAVLVDVAGAGVAVCSREDLKAMKRAAGRPRDLADLADLAAIEAG